MWIFKFEIWTSEFENRCFRNLTPSSFCLAFQIRIFKLKSFSPIDLKSRRLSERCLNKATAHFQFSFFCQKIWVILTRRREIKTSPWWNRVISVFKTDTGVFCKRKDTKTWTDLNYNLKCKQLVLEGPKFAFLEDSFLRTCSNRHKHLLDMEVLMTKMLVMAEVWHCVWKSTSVA